MKTVAIVGTSGSTRDLAPYQNKDVDIWMFNSQIFADWAKRCDLIIEMHDPATFMYGVENIYTKWLNEQTETPVYMQQVYPWAKASIRYPLEEIVARFLPNFMRDGGVQAMDGGSLIIQYFTSSVCYAIALAIHQGYERIELYGVDMANNTEYIYQRDGIALWFGIALGLGIEVHIPRGCAMFNAPLYGYSAMNDALSREEFERVASELMPMIEEAYGNMKQSDGVVQGILGELEAIKQAGNPDPKVLDDIGTRYSDAMNNYQQCVANYAALNGQYQLVRQFQMRVEKQVEYAGRAQEVAALREEWKPL